MKMKTPARRLLALAALATAILAGPVHAADRVDPEEARKAIEKVNETIRRAVEEGNAAAFAAQYTEDATVLPPDGEPVRGLKGIEAFWKGVMESGVKGAVLRTLEVENLGDTAWEVGTVELTVAPEGKEPTKQHGKYVVVWKKQPDGAWKLHRDIWNSMPAPKEAR